MNTNTSDHDYGDVFEFGLKDGDIVHVDNVANGLACGCICPNCETELVAYNNPKNKNANHFQHLSKTKCRNYYETALHYLAKKIIEEHKSLTVPDIKFTLPGYAEGYSSSVIQSSEKRVEKTTLTFDKVLLEKKAIDIRPDLKCITKGRTLFVEIAVTHFVDEEKRQKIYKNDFPVLEIDLSQFDRSIQKDKLRQILSGDIENMKWLYNPKIYARQKEAEAKAEPIKKFVSANIRRLKEYGKEQYIYNCPIYKNHYDKIKVQDECIRCRYYVGEWEAGYETGDEQPKYPEVTLDCIGHKANDFDKLLKSNGITWIEK
jgi:hypothetical protein